MGRKKKLSKALVGVSGLLILVMRTVTVLASPCQGDINNDGKVDGSDLMIMRAEMGRDNCYTEPCKADIDGDGMVGSKDRAIINAEFGNKNCLPDDGDMTW
ncbi:MAG: dockerin type I domain-containing protein, partial [Anaerolineales bacterium]